MRDMIFHLINGWATWRTGQKITYMLCVLVIQYAALMLVIAGSVFAQIAEYWAANNPIAKFEASLPFDSWVNVIGAQATLFVFVVAGLEYCARRTRRLKR